MLFFLKKIIYYNGLCYFSSLRCMLDYFPVSHAVKLHSYGTLRLLSNTALPGMDQLVTNL